MFCIYCGAPNPDDAAFCSACGKAIARTAAKAAPPRPVGAPDLPAQPAGAAGVNATAPARPNPTRERAREFTGKKGVVWAIAFSPDGGLMASGDSDATALLWDAVEGRELRRFPGTLCFRSTDFSPDGRRLGLAADDNKGTNSLSLWDSARPDQVRALTGHQGRVSCVRFSPDGLLLASGGTGVHLWDVSSGRIIKSLKPGWLEPKVEALSLAFSRDGRSIAVGDLHPSLWDVATGKEIRKFVSLGSIEKFRTVFVGFTPDGQSIVEARGNGKIRLWDVASGREKPVWRTRRSKAALLKGSNVARSARTGLASPYPTFRTPKNFGAV
jgi:WD40 repeat protein